MTGSLEIGRELKHTFNEVSEQFNKNFFGYKCKLHVINYLTKL